MSFQTQIPKISSGQILLKWMKPKRSISKNSCKVKCKPKRIKTIGKIRFFIKEYLISKFKNTYISLY